MFLKCEKDKMMIATVDSIPITVAVPMTERLAVSDVGSNSSQELHFGLQNSPLKKKPSLHSKVEFMVVSLP